VSGQDEPLRGFVSVEPFELRLEALVRISAYRDTWRISGPEITLANRRGILDNVGTLLESGVVITVEGKALAFTGRELRFVKQDPEVGYVTDDREVIPIEEALIGVTFSTDIRDVDAFTGEWFWFPPGQERVSIEISSRGRPSARYVSASSPIFSWEKTDAAAPPTLLTVPPVEKTKGRPLWFLTYLAMALGVVAVGTILIRKQESPAWVGTLLVGAVISALLGFTIKQTEVAIPEESEAKEITFRVLRNIYHAFDFRDESSVYDTLEKSVTGPLLEQVYLEIQSSLELESSGGPRVKVYEVALRDTNLIEGVGDATDPAMTIEANWATVGDVSHWGHTHERVNRYEAVMTIVPVEDQWKLRHLDLKNEERVQKVSRNQMVAEPVAEPAPESEESAEPNENEASSETP
jgi:hypothetical protein